MIPSIPRYGEVMADGWIRSLQAAGYDAAGNCIVCGSPFLLSFTGFLQCRDEHRAWVGPLEARDACRERPDMRTSGRMNTTTDPMGDKQQAWNGEGFQPTATSSRPAKYRPFQREGGKRSGRLEGDLEVRDQKIELRCSAAERERWGARSVAKQFRSVSDWIRAMLNASEQPAEAPAEKKNATKRTPKKAPKRAPKKAPKRMPKKTPAKRASKKSAPKRAPKKAPKKRAPIRMKSKGSSRTRGK